MYDEQQMPHGLKVNVAAIEHSNGVAVFIYTHTFTTVAERLIEHTESFLASLILKT